MAKNIAASLFVKPPKQSTTDTTTRQQAVPGSYMNVPTDKIDFFDKNPRKHRDDESYEQIKASIRATGVQHPVHITQRPDSDRFVLAQGGNTRLSIVKELWAETNDNRFASIPCIYVEYTSETDIQIAHLIENEQRQEMCFWDKAQGYSEIREIFQSSAGKEISQRQIVTVFATHGLSVSQGLLSLLFFANDKLQSLGNVAQYLSKSKTIEISKTYNDLKKRCKDDGKSEQDFEDWFVIALRDFAQYAETNTELDAGRLIEHLNISFSDYFDIQTANLFEEDECLPDTENSGLPESNLSGNLNNFQTPATAVENDFDGSVKSRSSSNSDTVRTPRVPKEYSYGVSEPESVDNNEQDTATVLVNQPTTEPTMLPETVSQNLSGNHNGVSDTATVVYENIKEWQKALHSKVQKVLDITFLSKCFVASDLFPLGFYVEYPKFDILKAVIPNHSAMYVIDRQHQDAGDVWKMLAKLSGQEHFFTEIENQNNPIMRLSDDSQFKQSFIDPEFEQRLILDLFGERLYLSDKIIRWLGEAQNELSLAIKALFSTLQAKPHTGDS